MKTNYIVLAYSGYFFFEQVRLIPKSEIAMRSLIEFWRNHMVLMIVLLFLCPAVVLLPFMLIFLAYILSSPIMLPFLFFHRVIGLSRPLAAFIGVLLGVLFIYSLF